LGQRFFARTFTSLENEQFRILWFGTLFSFLGMQMQMIARGYLAFELTGKNTALGLVMIAFGVPQLLLSLWGGVIADRLPKRRVLMVSQLAVALNCAWIAIMIQTGLIEFWMLVLAGAIQGAAFSFVGPTRQAFLGDLLERDRIGNAVVLQQLSMNSTRVIGPAVAGALIAIWFIGIGGVYWITFAGFLLAALTLLKLPPGNPAPRDVQRSPLADLRDGMAYVRRRPSILHLILVSFAVVMLAMPYQAFLPSLASDIYGVGAGGLGVLTSATAVGAVIATVFVAAFASHDRAWAVAPFLGFAFCLALVGLGFVDSFILGLGVLVLVGGFAAAFQSLNNSLTITYTDRAYHGRVQSMTMMSWSLFGIASLPIGLIADQVGIQETLTGAGVLAFLAIIALMAMASIQKAAADRFNVSDMVERLVPDVAQTPEPAPVRPGPS
jgi:MFS family permease